METGALSPHSRPHTLAKLDRRTREARLLAAFRREYTAHVGGRPSATQKTLIERASRLGLYIAVMDRQSAADGTMSEHNSRQYLAWSNALRLCLQALGFQAATAPAQSVADILASHEAAGP